MARLAHNLLELEVEKLFEEHKIDEIVEIEKLLDAEIERKRVELRSMVGDRYKDVLAASDAIKSMKTISENIVGNIQNITVTCEQLMNIPTSDDNNLTVSMEKDQIEERKLIIQLRLAIFMNEQIWIALDEVDNLKAAELYLLAQHIHTGLSLVDKKYLNRLPILQEIKANLLTLKNQIFHRINHKLESVEITAEENSRNLNALMLLQNQTSRELLNIFIDHRKSALNTVINSSHASVRVQISAMVQCLITTIHLLHDCFICYNGVKKGLIWQQLEVILGESSASTLSKLALPTTQLTSYIPDILMQFRPKYRSIENQPLENTTILEDWLQFTKSSMKAGLENALKLVTTVKGLHIIREEALKIELPKDWNNICLETNLPGNFNVWYYFFQCFITVRAKDLISKKIASIISQLQDDIKNVLIKIKHSEYNEADLRQYLWLEEINEKSHAGLSMKTVGYSQNIVNLCDKLDSKYLELLKDISQYLYGKEFTSELNASALSVNNYKNKFIDKEILENHLRIECTTNSSLLAQFLNNVLNDNGAENFVVKSLLCARFLQAIASLCPHFKNCCSFNASDDWQKICNNFNKSSLEFWVYWIDACVAATEKTLSRQFDGVKISNMISILPKWDNIEIQEQTEDKVFKSNIRVPLKPSLVLQNILNKLNDDLSCILPHTLPKSIHLQFIERNVEKILNQYEILLGNDLNQNQALQFLFDVKYLTTFCVPRDDTHLVAVSQEICDNLRSKIDPFDLDVFYSYLQTNIKRAVLQTQVILGCLLPSSIQLANLGQFEKLKEQDKEPSILAISVPSSSAWFPLLPVTVPTHKSVANTSIQKETNSKMFLTKHPKSTSKKSNDSATAIRSSAAALFGGLTTDWFS